jgi:hypothetical protein
VKHYVIEHPVVPYVSQDETGGFRVTMLPLRPYLADIERLEIDASRVVFIAAINPQMEESYGRVHSRILTPSRSIVGVGAARPDMQLIKG